jgi:hypothetical protein
VCNALHVGLEVVACLPVVTPVQFLCIRVGLEMPDKVLGSVGQNVDIEAATGCGFSFDLP